MNTLLNLVIVGLLVADVTVGLAVVNQGSATDTGVLPGAAARPTTAAPAVPGAPAPTPTQGSDVGVSRDVMEELQTSLVTAQALALQSESPIEAADLTTALPGLTFVNGFTAAGEDIIGVSADDETLLLVTQSGGGTWACAAVLADGSTALGSSDSPDPLLTPGGCASTVG